jgi:hypothetical protein
MKRSINHVMVKMEEVLTILDDLKRTAKLNAKDLDLINDIERKIRSLETRKRLIVIDGGRT